MCWRSTRSLCLLIHVSCAGGATPIDLYELCLGVRQQGVQFPMLLRFPEIVSGRLHEIQVLKQLVDICGCSVQQQALRSLAAPVLTEESVSAGVLQPCHCACWLSGDTNTLPALPILCRELHLLLCVSFSMGSAERNSMLVWRWWLDHVLLSVWHPEGSYMLAHCDV